MAKEITMDVEALNRLVDENKKLRAALNKAKPSVDEDSIKPILEKYHFFASQYPGANYQLADEDGTRITFTPRSVVTTDSMTGSVTETSIVGEFFTASPELAAELDRVQFGVRRMTEPEIVACVRAQIG